MRVLVTGATGYIGRQLVDRLLADGYSVRCLVRNPVRAAQLPERAEMVVADILQRETLAEALRGVDYAYYLVHSMSGGEAGFTERERLSALNFASAAKEAQIKRVIYLGGLGSQPDSAHLKSRQETGAILRAYGPPLIELRAGIIVGAGSASFEIIRSLAEKLPVMICPKWVTTHVQPIAITDVLAYLVAALEESISGSQIIEIGGSSVETYRSMILEYAKLRGLKRWLIRVPLLTPRLSSYWLDFVTSVPPSLTRPLIEGLRTEVTCQDKSAHELFPGIEPVSYREALSAALRRDDPGACSDWFVSGRNTLQARNGLISDCRQVEVNANLQTILDVLHSLGGGMGWLYADWLWRLRGWVDRLFGGVGIRRNRFRVIPLRAGDDLDFWRVEDASRDRLLLRAEMKVPGKAWLQFCFKPMSEDKTELRMVASLEPRGVLGQLYWWVLYPLHKWIFGGMLRAIASTAERRATLQRQSQTARGSKNFGFRVK